MYLLRHRQMLREATSETRDAVVEQIKTERPEAFHIETGANETLSLRVFYDEPAHPLPMAGFVRARAAAAEAA